MPDSKLQVKRHLFSVTFFWSSPAPAVELVIPFSETQDALYRLPLFVFHWDFFCQPFMLISTRKQRHKRQELSLPSLGPSVSFLLCLRCYKCFIEFVEWTEGKYSYENNERRNIRKKEDRAGEGQESPLLPAFHPNFEQRPSPSCLKWNHLPFWFHELFRRQIKAYICVWLYH